MRKFIISDLHGDGNVYKSIMSYLENVNKDEEIILYINGDLIDRGLESGDMLLDIKSRIENGPFKIIYLGGNHELMMYQFYKRKMRGMPVWADNWYFNGGDITEDQIEETLKTKEKIEEVVDFVANLKIYQLFEERINNDPIVLVHAACPNKVEDDCKLQIKDNNHDVEYYVWIRERDPLMPFRCRIGNKNFFTIIGHTPNENKYGIDYHKNSKYLNIDGGCAGYVKGYFEYDHVPLVEVYDGYLKILTFNNNNEIVYGNYFSDHKLFQIDEKDLEEDRSKLDMSFKPKKLIKLPDGIIGYEDWK